MKNLIIEAYIGEYASGKSENAINRALQLKIDGVCPVTLADLDTVEPCYTLRPIKNKLENLGLNVIAWGNNNIFGLGEAGSTISGEMRWVLKNKGHIIMDVGYGVHGAEIFNLIEGALNHPNLKIIGVINMKRPQTQTIELIVEHIKCFGRVDCLLNNTHIGNETTIEIVNKGCSGVKKAADVLGIEYIGSSIEKRLANLIKDKDCVGRPIRQLTKFMSDAFW